MSLADFLEGLAFFAVVAGAVLAVAATLLRRVLGHLPGPDRAVAFGLLATLALIAVHLVPGAVGELSRTAVAACAAAAALAVWRLVPGRAAAPEASPRSVGWGPARAWIPAAVGVGALGLWSLTALYLQWGQPSNGTDTVTHHLPNIAAWIQHETFWRVDQFAALLANGNYPHHGNVVVLSVVLPWENDAFVRPVGWVYLALTAIGIFAIAAELGAARPAGALFAAAFCATPAMLGTVQDGAMTDPVLLAGLAAGVLFLLRHLRTGRRSDLVLGGLGLGLAFGTKWYGVSAAAVVAGVWWAAAAIARGRGGRLRAGGALAAVVVATGGFWLVRNWVVSGNPVAPLRLEVLGLTVFDAPPDLLRERYGGTIFGYLGDWPVIRDTIIPVWRDVLGWPAAVIGFGVVAGLLVAIRGLRRRGDVAALAPAAAVATTLLLAAAYLVTPDTAFGAPGEPWLAPPNTRYLLPALVTGAAAAAWAAGRLGRAGLLLEAAALLAIAAGIRRMLQVGGPPLIRVAAVLTFLALAGWAWVAVRRRVPTAVRGAGPVALAGALLVAGLAVAYERQRTFNRDRYATTGHAAVDWLAANAREGRRIGLAGEWGWGTLPPVWPAFGPRMGNRVEYLGPTVDGQLRDYATAEAFAGALRSRGIELLVVGRGSILRGGHERFERWARAAGWAEVLRAGQVTLLRAPPRAPRLRPPEASG